MILETERKKHIGKQLVDSEDYGGRIYSHWPAEVEQLVFINTMFSQPLELMLLPMS